MKKIPTHLFSIITAAITLGGTLAHAQNPGWVEGDPATDPQMSSPPQVNQQWGPGPVPVYKTRSYVKLEAKAWLPTDSLFTQGEGLISTRDRIEFVGFGFEIGHAVSRNNRHWIFGEVSFGTGRYKRLHSGKGYLPHDPYYSNHVLDDNTIGQGGINVGYRYTRPVSRGITLRIGAYAGASGVGISDNYDSTYYDPYYDTYEHEDWSDDIEVGVTSGIEIGAEFQIGRRAYLDVSYGIEYQSASPDFQLSTGEEIKTRGVFYQVISVGFGWRF